MTERKPAGVSFETWVDKQIRDAQNRGEFDNLPGAGKPIPDLGKAHDDMWWVKQKMRRENLSFLPPALALRKEVEDAVAAAMRARSEPAVRQIVADINEKIMVALRRPTTGPPVDQMPLDVERVVRDWYAAQRVAAEEAAAAQAEAEAAAAEEAAAVPQRRSRWWRRSRRTESAS
jgi:hypothetical protein